MKKTKNGIVIAAALIFAVITVSCKSSPKKSKAADSETSETAASLVEGQEEDEKSSENPALENENNENAVEAESSVSQTTSDENAASETEIKDEEEESSKKSSKKASKKSKDSKKKKKEAEEEKQNYTGWVKASGKNISEAFGIIQLRVKSKFGAFSISVNSDTGKSIPVLSTSNEFVSNAFFLKNSRKIFALGTDRSVKTASRKKPDGAEILYSVPSVAEVSVEFKCLSSEKKVSMDMVKVTVTVTNKSTKIDDFSVKSVLDTVLGESDYYHFYNYDGIPVRNEAMYRTLQNQKWFISKNNSAAMQLFYIGADCTEPELVALANRSTLEKNSWEPDMLSYRAFDTVLSYNDSAVCAIWKPMKLEPNQSGKVIFYMAFAVDGAKPNGEKYVYITDEAEKKTVPDVAVEKITDASVTMPYTTISAVEEVSEPVEKPDLKTIPNVDFFIKNMTQEHLTPEYIQSLLDRIAALEEDSPSLNRQELLQLNAELDAILTYLRQ